MNDIYGYLILGCDRDILSERNLIALLGSLEISRLNKLDHHLIIFKNIDNVRLLGRIHIRKGLPYPWKHIEELKNNTKLIEENDTFILLEQV